MNMDPNVAYVLYCESNKSYVCWEEGNYWFNSCLCNAYMYYTAEDALLAVRDLPKSLRELSIVVKKIVLA